MFFLNLRFIIRSPIGEKVSWLLYGAAAGEPALGPVAYLHRMSASELPMAPLSHHLQDSTHTSFGVITTGLTFSRVKLEGSIFNGREPDEKRYSIQFAPLDSWSARVQRRRFAQLDGTVQLRQAGASRSLGARQSAPADRFRRICAAIRGRIVGDIGRLGTSAQGGREIAI